MSGAITLPGDLVRQLALMMIRVYGDQRSYRRMRCVCKLWRLFVPRVPPPPPITPFLRVLSYPHFHYKKTVCWGCLDDMKAPPPRADCIRPYCGVCKTHSLYGKQNVQWGATVSLQYVTRLILQPHWSLPNKYKAMGWFYANNCDTLSLSQFEEFAREVLSIDDELSG
jgi:hypothetical protein